MLHRACVFIRVFVFLCVWNSQSVRQQEIARVVRVGSTPRGTEKEQREHLPPHQEQLFNPLRRGDAGMGGGQRRVERWQAMLHSSAFLFHLFTFTVSSNSPPTILYTQWVHGDWCIFFHFSLSETKLQKHQLPVHLHIYKVQVDVLIIWTGKMSMHVWLWLCIHAWFNLQFNITASTLCWTQISQMLDCPDFFMLWLFYYSLWPLILAGEREVCNYSCQTSPSEPRGRMMSFYCAHVFLWMHCMSVTVFVTNEAVLVSIKREECINIARNSRLWVMYNEGWDDIVHNVDSGAHTRTHIQYCTEKNTHTL